MLIGDSGAGSPRRSTLSTDFREEVSEVNILIDDMGSLDITGDGR